MAETEKTNQDSESLNASEPEKGNEAESLKEDEAKKVNSQKVNPQKADPQEAEDLEETAEDESEEEAEANEEEGDGEEGGKAAGEGKKSWAERRAEKKQAKQKTDAMKEQIDQLEDKVKRQLAEFENFRNRTEREKSAMFETGARSVIEKILPVVDNFERGLATVDPEKQDDPFVDGMNKVYRQLVTELEGIGVKPIEAVGKEFDPNLHNAVMQVESEEYESGIVAQELQKGYTYRDTVVRHSMVSVVQ